MNIKSLLTTMIFCLVATVVQAVPAKPGVKKIVRQADGTVVELTLRGDEHFAFYTDAKGSAFKLLPGDKLQPMTSEQVRETWAKCRKAHMTVAPARTRGNGEPSAATTGKHRGLVILMQFKDLEFVTPEPKQVFDRFFNEVGYSEYGMSGSVKDYFRAQSYDKLDIDFDIVGPYTAAEPMAYYGEHAITDNEELVDAHRTEFAAEAVELASADVDYSKYDWDNDGLVDQVYIIYAGYAEAQGAAPETIWPHESDIRSLRREFVYNGVRVGTYGCSSELMGNGINEVGIIDGIGSACHEFSHCLGLLDTYNTDDGNASFGMSRWDVMDAGNYLNNSRTPAGFTSYERWFSGWLEPTELKGDMIHITDMKPLAQSPECYVIYNDGNKDEYYLLENRQNVGFDAALPGHGLLVLHVDYDKNAWSKNKINVELDHQRLTIIPADGDFNRISKMSLAGDPFPGVTRNTALANYTTPASTLYNANSDGSYYMSKAIDSITESEAGLISFVALRPEMLAPEWAEATEVKGEPSVNITWATVKDAASYQVELTENFTAQPADSLLCEFDLAQTQAESVGTTDISSKMADYGLPGWSGSYLFTSPGKLLIGSTKYAGEVKTAKWQVPSSKKITVVMGVGMVDEYSVSCQVYIQHRKNGDNTTYGKGLGFVVNAEGKYVLNFSDITGDNFFINIKPGYQMNLNYLAAYDGVWTENELGIGTDGSIGKAVARATVYNTVANSITINDLNPEHMYIYRVRAIGADNFSSNWTAKQSFQFDTSGISSLLIAPQHAGKIYDLQGRPRGTDPSALPKGIYIIGGRKVVK